MLTKALWYDAAAVCWVDSPVVVLQRVHELKNCAHAPDRVVDGCCANELGRKVRVERQLYLGRDHMHTRTVNIHGTNAGRDSLPWC